MQEKPKYYVEEYPENEDKEYTQKVLSKLSFLQMLELYSKSLDKNGNIVDEKAYWNTQNEIRNRLSVCTVEQINKTISEILERIEKVEAHLRNHRHDYSKTFTGKAEY